MYSMCFRREVPNDWIRAITVMYQYTRVRVTGANVRIIEE